MNTMNWAQHHRDNHIAFLPKLIVQLMFAYVNNYSHYDANNHNVIT